MGENRRIPSKHGESSPIHRFATLNCHFNYILITLLSHTDSDIFPLGLFLGVYLWCKECARTKKKVEKRCSVRSPWCWRLQHASLSRLPHFWRIISLHLWGVAVQMPCFCFCFCFFYIPSKNCLEEVAFPVVLQDYQKGQKVHGCLEKHPPNAQQGSVTVCGAETASLS